jgi:hypothetical protein
MNDEIWNEIYQDLYDEWSSDEMTAPFDIHEISKKYDVNVDDLFKELKELFDKGNIIWKNTMNTKFIFI